MSVANLTYTSREEIEVHKFSWLATLGERPGWRNKLERLPLLMSLLTIATILSQPLGMRMQALITTDAAIRDLRVTEITRLQRRDAPMHRVKTIN